MTKKGQQHRPFKLHRAGSIVCAGLQIFGVVFKVIAQERGDEVIAVVIPRLHAQGQWVARCLTGRLQPFGTQLRQKLVVQNAEIGVIPVGVNAL